MKSFRFRGTPTSASITDPQAQIDTAAGIIRGVSAIQAVEALGHGMVADQITLQQCVDAINSAPGGGVKSRFTHPGACSDALGKMLGRVTNGRIEGDKAICDLYLSQSSKVSPDGDLYTYVLTRAQEDPASFGLSIAFSGSSMWLLDDGSEESEEMADGTMRPRPANAVGDLPRARIAKLSAVDVVDEPAANRGGLFSKTFSLADDSFHDIDAFAQSNGIDQERLFQFASRYFSARGKTLSISPAGSPAPKNPTKGNAMKPEELKALKAKHPDHAGLIVDMFADGKTESEMLASIKDVQHLAALSTIKELSAKIEKLTSDSVAAAQSKDDQISKLSADLSKAAKVAELGTGAPPPIGGLESDELTGDASFEKQWSTDAKLRANWLNDKDSFIALSKLDAEQLATAGGKKSNTITPVCAANVTKPEGAK